LCSGSDRGAPAEKFDTERLRVAVTGYREFLDRVVTV
jgi:hypothetical protein